MAPFVMSCQLSDSFLSADKYFDKGAGGKLAYPADKHGDHIPDFSNCGYMGGGVRLPTVQVEATVEPSGGDDGERIQQAIDHVASLPLDKHGFRGAVLLKRGEYQIRDSISISASGIVLRGEGDTPGTSGGGSTTLIAKGTDRRTLITVSGSGAEDEKSYDDPEDVPRPSLKKTRGVTRTPKADRPREITSSRTAITDEYMPVGARSFRVENAREFSIGDKIMVHRPSTAEWIHEIGMDRIPPRQDNIQIVQWKPGSRDLLFDRVITDINGSQITVDAPLTNALDRRYGGGSVYKYEFPERISQVGIENLRGVSEIKGPTDEEHAWRFIRLDAVENAWVRNVTAEHFVYSLVSIDRWAKWVTVEDCSNLDPISQIQGGRRYSYALIGQLDLVQRCYARNGRHDFVPYQGEVAGPDVFLDCRADDAHSESGPHGRWCTGTLFDNVHIKGNELNIMNRGNDGTGHGWAGANSVSWNCSADRMTCENPPTAQNWAIGCKAKAHHGDGNWASFDHPVEPRSLYLAQLEERLGKQAVANIAEHKIKAKESEKDAKPKTPSPRHSGSSMEQ